jgi:hypothetical protein
VQNSINVKKLKNRAFATILDLENERSKEVFKKNSIFCCGPGL